MPLEVLLAKLQRPATGSRTVVRPRLIERLDEGAHGSLTLVRAPAGYGKTTLVSEWLANGERPVAWLSLDEGDDDPIRFLIYLVAALRTIVAGIGEEVSEALRSPCPPPVEAILTDLLNEVASVPADIVLVLDDYHVVHGAPVDGAVAYLLKHQPSRMHLVICTREEPHLPLARLRARGRATDVRAADLRFTSSETGEFLRNVMGVELSADDAALLTTRTEGWIVGLRLAAMALREHRDARDFIRSFSGARRSVHDYLIEEVLQRQPAHVQSFLLRTSILGRLCGRLCDAVLHDQPAAGQDMLETLERKNVFIVPLDDERRWYRYHPLFADVLRRRLHHRHGSLARGDVVSTVELHERARRWYEVHGFDVEAFHHAAAAADARRAHEGVDECSRLPCDAPARVELDRITRSVVDDGSSRARHGAGTALWIPYPVEPFRDEALSLRELQVLRLIAEGLSNREVAARLFRSLDTIKGHNRHLFNKLGVHSRTQAVAKAQELGLL